MVQLIDSRWFSQRVGWSKINIHTYIHMHVYIYIYMRFAIAMVSLYIFHDYKGVKEDRKF